MKYLNKYSLNIFLLGFIVSFYLTSCSEVLDTSPKDQISSETFWKSEKDVELALAGVYSRLHSYPFGHKDAEWDIMAGDVSGNQGHAIIDIAQGDIEPTSGGLVEQIYDASYQGISSCNFFLANIDQTPIADEKLNRYKGEVRFLRALFYFTLTETYGGVPLYTEPVTVEEAKVKQSTKEQVVEQILNDLDFAIDNLPNTGYSDGHAVKGSALALKAKVLLHNQQWQEAADAANQIIQDGVFSLYDDYRDLFLARGQNDNPEIIFSTRYNAPDITSNLDIRWSWHGVVNPRQELVDAYECIDGQPVSSSPQCDSSNWENRDPRLHMTVKAFEDSVVNSSGETVGFNYNATSGTGYTPVKYCNWDALPIDYSTQSEQDWILLRYADVLLMYAEAKNEVSGPDNSVYQAIDQVRNRVGMPPIPDGLSKEEMRERIRHERRVELALEGVRWGDIKRWKTAEDYIPTLVDPGGTRRQFDPSKHYLMPFPQSEIDINPNLEQNPGY